MAQPRDFMLGDRVIYVPHHAMGKLDHPDAEQGTVTMINKDYVFVNFGGKISKACSPNNLVHGEKVTKQ